MASKVRTLCDELSEKIRAAWDAAEGGELEVGYGAAEMDRNSRPPRIVWRVVNGVHEGTNRPGLNPRPLFTRRLDIEAHLWGRDEEQAELLLEHVARAVQKAAVGAFTPAREEWPAQDDDRRSHNVKGAYCLMTFEALIPVTAATQKTATVTAAAFDTSTSSLTDGNLDAGEG